ncbi:MAG TPA: hypothetical protein VNM90_26760 [Haliangium sp.]|nr:hypothetical protein [Haliangium sp.]
MNLNILSTNVMLAQSKQWLTGGPVRAPLNRYALGQAVLAELGKSHDRLSMQAERRRQYEAALARLTRLISATDLRHDRKARALHAALQGLIDAEDDADVRELYLAVQALLFPEGLAIVNRTFAYQAGAIEALEKRMTPEVLSQLASLTLGTRSLASVYLEWVAAGNELGSLVAERERLLDRTGRGSAAEDVDMRAARLQWISTVHAFLSVLELMDLAQEERAAVLSPLEAAIASAVRSREGDGDEPGDGDLPPADDVVAAPAPRDGAAPPPSANPAAPGSNA